MYDELVKELRHLDEYSKQINPTPSGIFREAADAIEELYAINQRQLLEIAVLMTKPRWIPVTERLPEIHTNVLVRDKAHDMAVGSLEKLWDGEMWVCPFSAVDDEQCPVTHWMPLPEPPKEET